MGLKLRRQEVKMITSRKQKGYTYRSRRTNEDHIFIKSLPHLHALEEFLGVFSNVRYEPTVSLTQSLPEVRMRDNFLPYSGARCFIGPKKSIPLHFAAIFSDTKRRFLTFLWILYGLLEFTAEELSRNVPSLVVFLFIEGDVSDKERRLEFSRLETCC
jgi:hypothetical protein